MKYLVSLLQIVLIQLHLILFQLHLKNSSLANDIFPRTIGSPQGLITSLFKNAAKEATQTINYRAISVISIIGKVFERIIYHQLFASLSDHSILSTHQNSDSMRFIQQLQPYQRPVILIQVTLTLLLFLTLGKRLTKSVMISYCLYSLSRSCYP